MPEQKTLERARRARREGKSPSTQAERVRARGDRAHPRGQARRQVDEAGDRDRIVQGSERAGVRPSPRLKKGQASELTT